MKEVIAEIAPCDFETAIQATKFGKFNVLLIILTIPALCAIFFQVTAISYVFPVAQCDLDLSLKRKGILNALSFAGMVSSSFMWGFLCDAIGRKQVLIIQQFLGATFVFIGGLSQNFAMLVVTQFFGGFVLNGTIVAITTYLAEFHSVKYRARIQLVRGLLIEAAAVVLAGLAWAMLPRHIEYESEHVTLHPWNFFLLASTLAPLTGGLISCFMPESPKFLLTLGKGEEALEILRKVYAMNTGRPKESYPVTELKAEHRVDSLDADVHAVPMTKRQALKNQCLQLKKVFDRQHSKNLTLGCVIMCIFFCCINTVRLWLPQIFQTLNDYLREHKKKASFCAALKILKDHSSETEDKCFVNVSDSVYVNTLILTSVAIIGYFLCSLIVRMLGTRRLLGLAVTASTMCAVGLYFCDSVVAVLATASLFYTLLGVALNLLMSIVMEMFPTTMRAMTLSFVLLTARMASMLGNLIFPVLMSWGCEVAVFALSSLLFASVILVYFLPLLENQALK